jgi:hypothetical protein
MKGLIPHPEISDRDLDKIIATAFKKKSVSLTFITPHNNHAVLKLEVTRQRRGYSRVLLDTYTSNWDITPAGQENFVQSEKYLPDPEDRINVSCGKRVMRMDVKKTGEGIVLAFMLRFLEDGHNLEDVRIRRWLIETKI